MGEPNHLYNHATGETLTTADRTLAQAMVASGAWQRGPAIADPDVAALEPLTDKINALIKEIAGADNAAIVTKASTTPPTPIPAPEPEAQETAPPEALAPTVATPETAPPEPVEAAADFTQIPGVDVEIAQAMRAAGFVTWADVATASQRQLRALAGVGSARAKAIKEYAQTQL